MDYTNLVPVIGIIVNITRGNDCCSQMVSLRTENGIVNFAVDMDTVIIDSDRQQTTSAGDACGGIL